MEFVMFDAHETEMGWIDPVVEIETISSNKVRVCNGYDTYLVIVPEGGRYEVRPTQAT